MNLDQTLSPETMRPTLVEAQRAFLCKGQSVLTNGIPHIFSGSGSSLSGIPLHSWQSGSSPLAGGQPGATGVKELPQAAPASEGDNASPHRSASCFSSLGSCAQLPSERGSRLAEEGTASGHTGDGKKEAEWDSFILTSSF